MSRCSCKDAAKRREGPVHSYERKKPTLAGARYSSSYTPRSSMIARSNSRAVSASTSPPELREQCDDLIARQRDRPRRASSHPHSQSAVLRPCLSSPPLSSPPLNLRRTLSRSGKEGVRRVGLRLAGRCARTPGGVFLSHIISGCAGRGAPPRSGTAQPPVVPRSSDRRSSGEN